MENPAIVSIARSLLVAIVYFAGAELGLSLAALHSNVTPVWPPTGIAIASLLIFGRQVTPGIFVGALAANLFTTIPVLSSFGIATGMLLISFVGTSTLMTLFVAAVTTERRKAEEEKSRLGSQLELHLQRESQARQEAEEASRLKEEFLATVSHELRTPLNAVVGWSRLLRAGQLDKDSTAHAVEVIERNAAAQRQIIEDLLDVSQIVTGKLQTDRARASTVDLA